MSAACAGAISATTTRASGSCSRRQWASLRSVAPASGSTLRISWMTWTRWVMGSCSMAELTSRQILERNAPLFAERDRVLTEKAIANPLRLPYDERTWQDHREIAARVGDHDKGREYGERVMMFLRMAPDLETFEALLRGERVPKSRLDPDAVKAYGQRAQRGGS